MRSGSGSVPRLTAGVNATESGDGEDRGVVGGPGLNRRWVRRVRVHFRQGERHRAEATPLGFELPFARARRDDVSTEVRSVHRQPGSVHREDDSVHKDSGTVHEQIEAELDEAARAMAAELRAKKRAPPALVRETIVRLCQGRFLSLPELARLTGRTTETLRIHYVSKLLAEGRLRHRHPGRPRGRRRRHRYTRRSPRLPPRVMMRGFAAHVGIGPSCSSPGDTMRKPGDFPSFPCPVIANGATALRRMGDDGRSCARPLRLTARSASHVSHLPWRGEDAYSATTRADAVCAGAASGSRDAQWSGVAGLCVMIVMMDGLAMLAPKAGKTK